jgi:hypothetical protein
MRVFLMLIAVLVAAALGLLVGGNLRWRRTSDRMVAQLAAEGTAIASPAPFRSSDLDSLPAPVAAYFRAAISEGRTPARTVHLTQEGSFLLSPKTGGWQPFTATQDIATQPAGFLWDARIRMGPGLVVRVRDGYVGGEGALRAAVLGLVTVARVEGTPEMAQGELLRYLAEGVWVPTALLPSAGVRWSAIDDSSARATLRSGETEVSLDFFFGADHLVTRIFTAVRPYDQHGENVPTPWQGRFAEYAERDGMRIPLYGEVEWLLASGAQLYWRGRVLSIAYY